MNQQNQTLSVVAAILALTLQTTFAAEKDCRDFLSVVAESAPRHARSVPISAEKQAVDLAPGTLVKPFSLTETMSRGVLKTIFGARYRIKTIGLDKIKAAGTTGTVFLLNHPSFFEPSVIWSTLHKDFRAQPTMVDFIYDGISSLGWGSGQSALNQMGAVRIPLADGKSPEKYQAELKAVFDELEAGLREGRNYFVFASGNLYRTMFERVGNARTAWELKQRFPEVRFVKASVHGLWGSIFGSAQFGGKLPSGKALVDRLKTAGPYLLFHNLLAKIFPLIPDLKREIIIRFEEGNDLPTSSKLEFNQALTDFFNQDARAAEFVPYYWWQKSYTIPEPKIAAKSASAKAENVPRKVREQLQAVLRKITDSPDATYKLSDPFGEEIGLDSLRTSELALAMAEKFAFKGSDFVGINTFGDLLLLANKEIEVEEITVPEAPEKWFNANATGRVLELPRKDTIVEMVQASLAKDPNKLVATDLPRGYMTAREILTGINFLTPIAAKVDSPVVGTLFPASTGGAIVNLAVMNAGKTPHPVNFKAGEKNLPATIKKLVKALENQPNRTRKVDFKIITAKVVIDGLEASGEHFSTFVKSHFIYLEDIAKADSKWKSTVIASVQAAAKAYYYGRTYVNKSLTGTRRLGRKDHSVILATTGSEKTPKLVPLTHENQITNMIDVLKKVQFTDHDVMMSFLPFFHSFGEFTTLMAMSLGMPTVFHANPQQPKVIADLIQKNKATLLAATPTFARELVLAAEPGQLDSVRVLVSGGEGMPTSTKELIEERIPGVKILEGYGITEASPVVSLNSAENPQPGTVGEKVDSLEYELLDANDFEAGIYTKLEKVSGTVGRKVIRGPSIFDGYLGEETSPFVEFNGYRWYDTGDIMELVDPHKSVTKFIARAKRIYKPGGEMVSIEAVEDTLTTHFATEEQRKPVAMVVVGTDENPITVLFSRISGVTKEEANRALRDAGYKAIIKIDNVVARDTFPELSGGLKTDYTTLKSEAKAQFE